MVRTRGSALSCVCRVGQGAAKPTVHRETHPRGAPLPPIHPRRAVVTVPEPYLPPRPATQGFSYSNPEAKCPSTLLSLLPSSVSRDERGSESLLGFPNAFGVLLPALALTMLRGQCHSGGGDTAWGTGPAALSLRHTTRERACIPGASLHTCYWTSSSWFVSYSVVINYTLWLALPFSASWGLL